MGIEDPELDVAEQQLALTNLTKATRMTRSCRRLGSRPWKPIPPTSPTNVVDEPLFELTGVLGSDCRPPRADNE
jgi:hypothetical protein